MADPLSISGTAVGIVSLGITVCGAFFDYYNAWKSYSGDIARTAASVHHLSQIFLQINEILGRGNLSDAQKKCIEESLFECQESLSKLEKKLKKIERQPLPTNMVEHFKNAKRRLLYPFLESTLVKVREHVSDAESVLDTAMSVLQLDMVIDGMNRLALVPEKIDDVISRLDSASQANSAFHRDVENRQLLTWLELPDVLSVHHRHRSARHSGTGQWIFEHQDYIAWSTGASRNLWIHGIPGCGKSVLASKIIDTLSSEVGHNASVALLFFYFDFEDTTRQTGDSLLRSTLGQLCIQSKNMPEPMRQYYLDSDKASRKPDMQSSYTCFQSICHAYDKILIVVDALDECSTRKELFNILRKLSSTETGNVFMLLTSRQERDIEYFSTDIGSSNIGFQEQVTNQDIAKYVQNVMIEDTLLKRWPENIRMEMETALIEQANGMFQWVICQVASLKKCLSVNRVRNSLETMPKDLNGTYKRILRNLDEDYGSEVLIILRWLLYSERPMLLEEVAEVLAVDAHKTPSYDAGFRLRDTESIIDICSSLVTVVTSIDQWDYRAATHPRKEVRLAHFSVKTYLLSDHAVSVLPGPLSTQGHMRLAEDCVAYLLNIAECDKLRSDVRKNFPLVDYAARYWYQHARKVVSDEDTEVLDKLAINLFSSSSAMLLWNKFHDVEEDLTDSRLHMEVSDLASPLYYISCAGLARYVPRFCSMEHQDENSRPREGVYGSPLIAAAYKGFQDVVEKLLEYKTPTNLIKGKLGTALQAATASGNEKMVSLLIKCGEDINVRAGKYGSALQAAAYLGHITALRHLLGAGADVNIGGGQNGSALAAAAFAGRLEVVAILLEAGAEIHRIKKHHRQYFCSPDFNPVTPSLRAGRLVLRIDDPLFTSCYHLKTESFRNSQRSDLEIVNLILHRLPAHLKDRQYLADMLFVASLGGNDAIVEALLREDCFASDARDALQNALLGAFRSGHQEVVDTLMARGATFDWDKPGYSFELLSAVAVSHCPALLHLLLANHPLFHYKHVYMAFCFALEAESDESMLSPLISQGLAFERISWERILITACRSLKPNVLEFVLENTQMNVNTELSRQGCALSNEARDGNTENLRIWLKNGANVNMEGGRYGYPLHAAICRGDLDGVSTLLDAGADVNMIGIEGPALVSVLQYRDSYSLGEYVFPPPVVQDFITKAVRLILSHDPDIDRAGRSDLSPLCLALGRGLDDVARDLLAAGANKDYVDRFGRNALFWAALRGNGSFVKDLLKSTSVEPKLPDAVRAAINGCSWEIVESLVDAISDFNVLDSSGNGCLFHALYCDRPELATKLRGKGALEPDLGPSFHSIGFISTNTAPHSTIFTENKRLQVKGNEWGADLSWRSNVAVSQLEGVSYFEVKVLDKLKGYIKIGLCDENFLLHHQIGDISGIGVSSSGWLEAAGSGLKGTVSFRFCASWGQDDVLGCGFDFSTSEFLFTRNGVLSNPSLTQRNNPEVNCTSTETYCFAISTTAENVDLQVNLDSQSFVFDLESYQRGEATQFDWQNANWKEIDGEPAKDEDRTELDIILDLCASP